MNTERKGARDQDSQPSEDQTFQRDIAIDRADYRLPFRDTRKLVGFLLIPLVGSLAVIVFMCFWMRMQLAEGIDLLQQNKQFGWAMIAFGSAGLLGLIPTIGVFFWSIGAMYNRSYCTVAVTTKKMVCTERALIARRRRKIKTEEIQRLVVVSDLSDVRPQKPTASDNQHIGLLMLVGSLDYHLIAETKSGGIFCVALGYPKTMLMDLAADLVPRLDSEAPSIQAPIQRSALPHTDNNTGAPGIHKTGIQIIDSDQVEAEPLEPSQTPPEGTKIEVARREDGITIEVPARKDWAGAKFMKIFATIWNAFVWSAFFGMMANFQNNGFSFLFVLPFVIAGIAMILFIRHQSTSSTTIATADDLLFIQTKSQLRQRRQEWKREQIQRICVGDSNTEINGERIQELQIHVLGTNKFGFLSQLSADEMNWVSALLNDALAIPEFDQHHYPFRDQQDRPIPAKDSRASVSYSNDEAIISLPGKSLAGLIFLSLMGFLFVVIGLVVFAFVFMENQFADKGVGIFITIWTLGFVGCGMSMVVYAYFTFKTRFELWVNENRLDVHRWGVFGQTQHTFTKDEIGDLKVTDTGMKINEQRQLILQIGRDPSKSIKIAQSRPEADLQLAATVINETLK